MQNNQPGQLPQQMPRQRQQMPSQQQRPQQMPGQQMPGQQQRPQQQRPQQQRPQQMPGQQQRPQQQQMPPQKQDPVQQESNGGIEQTIKNLFDNYTYEFLAFIAILCAIGYYLFTNDFDLSKILGNK